MKRIVQYLRKEHLATMRKGAPIVVRCKALDLEIEIRLDEDAKKQQGLGDFLRELTHAGH